MKRRHLEAVPALGYAVGMGLLVVTDLDGTLLDHQSYGYSPALPAIDRLKRHAVPIVLATSKTAAEVAPLHQALELADAPAIVENGAGIIWDDWGAIADGDTYSGIHQALSFVPPHLRKLFQGFGDMSAAEVAETTGLSLENATLAKDRKFSEPGLWSGTDNERAEFEKALVNHGIHTRFGGRFLTLSMGTTKADAMEAVAQKFNATTVIALGDAPNDREMLEAADVGVVIANTHGTPLPPLPGEAEGRIRRTTLPGPSGWNAAVHGILDEWGST